MEDNNLKKIVELKKQFTNMQIASQISSGEEIQARCSNEMSISRGAISYNVQHDAESKKKKTRRKPRYTCKNIGGYDNGLDNFKITAVTNQTGSKAFRTKNYKCCRHINLNYYYQHLESSADSFSSISNEIEIKYNKHDASSPDINKSFVNDETGTRSKSQCLSNAHNSIFQSRDKHVQNTRGGGFTKKEKNKSKVFLPYWSLNSVQDGLENNALQKGVIRINPKFFREAYVSHTDRLQQDYLIEYLVDRNRALEGDVVVIKIKPKNEWTEKQKTAFVVYILEKVHSRIAVGTLNLMPDKNKQNAAFIPRDCRVPRLKIPLKTCPTGFQKHPNRFENMLFTARLTAWNQVKYANGILVENIGLIGDLESESAAILSEYNLDVSPFPAELLNYITITDTIPDKEFQCRIDLRKQCVFTIDPLTARDLDDAVSCKELENGNLEVGVHISDVSYYLTEGTPLDKMVCSKATTIYLVNSVYHMLPKELCLHCSLLPGTDKLAFSVFWEMTKDGEIISKRFARTIVNSCTQLAYEHAQKMIEQTDCTFEKDELPQIYGGFTYKDLSRTVQCLQKIAVNLRDKRFEAGALRINQTKLLFKLDENTGEPVEYFVYENKDSHRLIEEFMLLANASVAEKILNDFPHIAFLRQHDPPNQRLLNELQNTLNELNISIDVSSAKAIQSSLINLENSDKDDSILAALNHLFAKPMSRAKYFCAGDVDEENYHHYALHTPLYTHFTSPIRRYADIMVHRLLSASLGCTPKPRWTAAEVTSTANLCNAQKYNAKCAGEASSDLYLAHYVVDNQPFIQKAVVLDVKNTSFDLLVMGTGSVIRIHPNSMDSNIKWTLEEKDSRKQFIIVFPETTQLPEETCRIEIFSIVKVNLNRRAKTNKLEAKLLRPISGEL